MPEVSPQSDAEGTLPQSTAEVSYCAAPGPECILTAEGVSVHSTFTRAAVDKRIQVAAAGAAPAARSAILADVYSSTTS